MNSNGTRDAAVRFLSVHIAYRGSAIRGETRSIARRNCEVYTARNAVFQLPIPFRELTLFASPQRGKK